MLKDRVQREIEITNLFNKQIFGKEITPIEKKNNSWIVGYKPKYFPDLYLTTAILNLHKIGIRLDFYLNNEEMWASSQIRQGYGYGLMRDGSIYNILAYMELPLPYFPDSILRRPKSNDQRWITSFNPILSGLYIVTRCCLDESYDFPRIDLCQYYKSKKQWVNYNRNHQLRYKDNYKDIIAYMPIPAIDKWTSEE